MHCCLFSLNDLLEMDGIKTANCDDFDGRTIVVGFGWHFSENWLLTFLEGNTFGPWNWQKNTKF